MGISKKLKGKKQSIKLPTTNFSAIGFTSKILHIDAKEGIDGAIHHAVQPSVTFGYRDVNDLIDVFQGRKKGYVYSRNSSPSISALEKKITLLEEGLSSLVFATGLAAISSTFLSLLRVGDHVVASCYLFGNTHSFFNTLKNLGFEIDFVDVCKVEEVKKKLKPETKFFFAETIANPGTQIPDWEGITQVLKEHHKKKRGRKIVSIVDNTITTPYLFSPRSMGFSFSINSLTKYIAGQGSCLAGSLTDLGNWEGYKDENILPIYKKERKDCQMLQIRKKGMRDLGATLSPYVAHLVSLGLETLSLRMEKQIKNAQAIAEFLLNHPKIKTVYFPGLKTHPQFHWAKKWYRGSGAIMSFTFKTNSSSLMKLSKKKNKLPFPKKPSSPMIRFMNSLKFIIKSSHLGDTRTLSIPVAQTIFHEMGQKERDKMKIDENQIRLSVGIEDLEDLIADLKQALEKV